MPVPISFKTRIAIEKIKTGEVIAYPTEAVYGLGCDPLNETAVLKLLSIKKRSVEKGLILIASSLSQLEPYLQLDNAIITRVQSTWPGAVTWIIPAQTWVPKWLTGKHCSLAVRVTAHPIARFLCQATGEPLISTSANTNDKPAATSAWMVAKNLGTKNLFILPGPIGTLKQATPIYDVMNQQKIR